MKGSGRIGLRERRKGGRGGNQAVVDSHLVDLGHHSQSQYPKYQRGKSIPEQQNKGVRASQNNVSKRQEEDTLGSGTPSERSALYLIAAAPVSVLENGTIRPVDTPLTSCIGDLHTPRSGPALGALTEKKRVSTCAGRKAPAGLSTARRRLVHDVIEHEEAGLVDRLSSVSNTTKPSSTHPRHSRHANAEDSHGETRGPQGIHYTA